MSSHIVLYGRVMLVRKTDCLCVMCRAEIRIRMTGGALAQAVQ